MKNSYQQWWYCISEDEYLNEDFFNVICKTAHSHIEVVYLKSTSNILIKLYEVLEKDPTIALYLSDIRDQMIDSVPDEKLDEEVFKEYQDLYNPSFFYFLDTDRLHINYYLSEHNKEASTLKKKLFEQNDYVRNVVTRPYYLIPSFPSLATFAW